MAWICYQHLDTCLFSRHPRHHPTHTGPPKPCLFRRRDLKTYTTTHSRLHSNSQLEPQIFVMAETETRPIPLAADDKSATADAAAHSETTPRPALSRRHMFLSLSAVILIMAYYRIPEGMMGLVEDFDAELYSETMGNDAPPVDIEAAAGHVVDFLEGSEDISYLAYYYFISAWQLQVSITRPIDAFFLRNKLGNILCMVLSAYFFILTLVAALATFRLAIILNDYDEASFAPYYPRIISFIRQSVFHMYGTVCLFCAGAVPLLGLSNHRYLGSPEISGAALAAVAALAFYRYAAEDALF